LVVDQSAAVDDAHVAANAAVLVDDGPLDDRAVADREIGSAPLAVDAEVCLRLEIIGAVDHRVAQNDIAANLASQTDDAAMQVGTRFDHAAVTDETMLHPGGADARCRQET